MVGNTRGAPDSRRIRRLKSPRALEVEAGADGVPLRLRLGGAWHDVSLVRHPWRIDQNWWRGEPMSRMYYRIAPTDGPPLTVYCDLASGEWFRQEY